MSTLILEDLELDVDALADLRRSAEVQALLEEKAREAQRMLGAEHYGVKSYSFGGVGGRAVTKVYASDYAARIDNLRHNSIIKAVLATREAGA